MSDTKHTPPTAEQVEKEIARCKDLLGDYENIGWHGAFAASQIQVMLKLMERAISENSQAGIQCCYDELRKFE